MVHVCYFHPKSFGRAHEFDLRSFLSRKILVGGFSTSTSSKLFTEFRFNMHGIYHVEAVEQVIEGLVGSFHVRG